MDKHSFEAWQLWGEESEWGANGRFEECNLEHIACKVKPDELQKKIRGSEDNNMNCKFVKTPKTSLDNPKTKGDCYLML